MLSRLRSFWQKAKKPLEIIIVSVFVLGFVVLFILIILGIIFQWPWTGFGAATTDPKQHAKTLWDWLQLLIIPVVLAIGGYVFNLTTSRNEQQNIRLRDQTERDIAGDNQREVALQGYLDRMQELLLHEGLRKSKSGDEVRNIARVRTLTMLYQLDTRRTNYLLAFLREAGLLTEDNTTNIIAFNNALLSQVDLHEVDLNSIDLSGANLGRANLSRANLGRAYLSRTNLSGADLGGANLSGANLNGANLGGANLNGANLNGANLSLADLGGADLGLANLSGANLNGANLGRANLIVAYLGGANLSEANLSRTDLSGADLSGADLGGANLNGAKYITTEQLDKAMSLQKAIMPDGSTHG